MVERLHIILLVASNFLVSGVLSGSIITIENKCNLTVWPVIYSWESQVSPTGFALKTGEARALQAPSSWHGLISGRTLCSNGSTGNFLCATGDCESGKIECPGRQYSWSPVTYLYFRIDIGGVSSYFISLEYGYNLPIKVVPSQTSPTCFSSGCMVDLKETCPEDLDLFDGGKQIGCVSACRRYDTPEICCSQEFKTKQKCKPTMYTRNFERACPFVYSYPYHDFTSTWTCPTSTDFVVTFCPSSVPNNTRLKPFFSFLFCLELIL